MATAPSAAANPLAGVAALLETLGGTRSTQTSNPGNTSYLEQVFGQMNGNDPNAALASIFQKAGGQIPGFQRAFGNAVGARSGNNSAVAAVLQKLLQDTTIAAQDNIAKQSMQNQANMGTVAGGIANATKGTTQTTKSGTDMGKAIQALMMMQAAGRLGVTDKLGGILGIGGSSGGGATSTASAPAAPTVSAPSAMSSGGASSGAAMSSAALPAYANLNSGLDINADLFSQPGMGSMEWANGATLADGFSTFSDMFADQANNLAVMEGIDPLDALIGVTDGFGTVESGGSFIDSLLGGGGDFLDSIGSFFGFADGGMVGRDGKSAIKSYADGGIVGRSRGPQRPATLQTANPIMTPAVNNAAQSAPRQQVQQQPMNGIPAASAGIGSTATGISLSELAGMGPDTGVNSSGQTASPEGLAAVNGVLGAIGVAMGGMGGSALAGSLGLGPLGGLLGSMAGRGFVNNAITANNAPAGGFNSTAGISVGDPGVANGFGAISSAVSSNDLGPGIDLGFLGATNSSADAGVGVGGGNGGDAASVGVGAGDSGSSDAGFGGTLANGGEVSGPGTGTSDSILAKLSDGEYVISADVVDKIGVDFFDLLQKQYHTPVANRGRA